MTDTTGVKKVLIVEDETPIARVLSIKLTKAGYAVDVARDGQEGLEKIQNGSYAAILLDLMMPRMNGFDVLRLSRKTCPNCHIIVLTNLSQEEDRNKALALGADEFFVKSDTPLTKIVATIHSKI